MTLALVSGSTYWFKWLVIFESGAASNGIRLGLTFPAATIVTAHASIHLAADGAAATFEGELTSSGDSVVATGVAVANTPVLASIEGIILPTASANLALTFGSELSTTNGVRIRQQSFGILRTIS
jgi:hypothetical protein